jgi:hypothetical protein
MNNDRRSSLLVAAHVILALATGAILCICAGLLLLDSPSGLFNTGGWIDNPAPKYTLAMLTAAFSAGAVLYLNRAALLGLRARIALVAAIPGAVSALLVFLLIALTIHPIGF